MKLHDSGGATRGRLGSIRTHIAAAAAALAAAAGCSTGAPEADDPAPAAGGADVVATRSELRGGQSFTRQKLRAADGSTTGVAIDAQGRRVADADIPAFTREPIGPRLRQALAQKGRADERLDVVVILRNEVEEAGDAESTVSVSVSPGGAVAFAANGKATGAAAVIAGNEQLLAGVDRRQAARAARQRAAIEALAKRHQLREDAALAAGSRAVRHALTRGQIEQLIARSSDLVEGIELYEAPQASTAGALASMGVDAWAHNQGVRGAGVGIYMSEAGGGCPVSPHIDTARFTNLTGAAEAWHADVVGNVLRVTAPQAHIFCGPADSMVTNPASFTPRVHVTNHSWNYYTTDRTYWPQDRDFDDAVYNNRISVFVSAGNGDQVSNTNVLTPGKAFNVFAVGNYDDDTNTMNAGSRFVNPTAGHEKPEISAPGTNIGTTAGWATGTSLSSPFAAGFAANILSQHTWLQGHPEAIKAMMMAGASRNLEGAAALSDRDGAGGINYLNTGYNGSLTWWAGGNNTWFDATNKVTFQRYLVAGQRYRMALSWLVSGSYAFSNNNVNMDLDTWVTAPNGSTVAGSYSYDNGFEIVDFIAPVSGNFTVTLHRFWNSGVGDVVMAHHTQAIY